MPYPPFPGRPLRRVLFALALASAVPLGAQYPGGAIVQPLPNAGDPAEKLAAALRMLAVSPRALSALIEAGRDALTLGDPNAAVGFFGRASEVSPRDGRVKAGLGAALVQLEKPREALRYFQEASAVGVADADLAEDRGLAYDLVGDPAHAQADYRTVLAAHPDDDAARRRLALSQGISGDRAGAIATLDPLIRKRDIAAWRAQTFVLAMTGDARGANDITRVMLPQQQAMLQPFLERLASLSPGDKARAVHFGEMPAAGRRYSDTQLASIGTPATYAPAPAAPRPAAPVRAPIPAIAPVRAAEVAVVPARRSTPAPGPPPPVTSAARVAVASPPSAPPLAALTAHAPSSNQQPRYVSAEGAPMRRIEHSAQEMFTLGLPRYEYVPEPAPREQRPETRVAAAAPPTIAATAAAVSVTASAVQPAPPPRVAAAFTIAPRAVAIAASGTAAPVSAPSADGVSPSPPVAVGPANADPIVVASTIGAAPSSLPAVTPAPATVGGANGMPVGASGAGGHFDVPHEIADRQPVPRTPQATARAPVAIPARPAPPSPDAPASGPGAANPTVLAARRARGGGGIEAIAADRPARVGHTRAMPAAPGGGGDATVADGSATAMGGTRRDRDPDRIARGGRDTAASIDRTDRRIHPPRPASRDDDRATGAAARDQDTPPARGRNRRDDRTRPAPRDDGSARRTSAKDKSDKPSAGPRVYVQVAGGANKADMDKAWAAVKARAPDLMKDRAPSTTPLHATNRLLVGPFKDADEAQAFVNKMAGRGLSGFTFRSGKGQKVDKVDGAR